MTRPDMKRLDESLAKAAKGPNGTEFRAAYAFITQMDHRNPQARAVVKEIVYAADPGEAMLIWWRTNSGELQATAFDAGFAAARLLFEKPRKA